MIRRLGDVWAGYWFRPAAATDLAVCRILASAIFLQVFRQRDFSAWAGIPDVFWQPIPAFRWLGLTPAPEATLLALGVVWKLSLAAVLLGVFTRVGAVVAMVLGFYLLGLAHNFGKTDHADTVVPLVLLVLACSRCGDALSVDAWRRRRKGGSAAPGPSGSYTWPIRAVWMLTGLVFGAAGFAKIANGGIAWITSDSMRYILIKHHYGGFRPSTLGLQIAEHAWLYKPMAAAGMLAEALAPLAMFSRVARLTVIPALALMITGFQLVLGFAPRPYYALFVFFVPWSALLRRLRGDPA